MRIILAGGGDADDSLPLDKIFADWIRPGGRLLYLPIASRGIRTFESCFEWITSTFSPLKVTDITMWTSLIEHRENELDLYSGVLIGGGNTFSLLAELRESGFDEHLKEYAKRGGPIYGGSAGAVVLGRDIQTVNHIDTNDIGLKYSEGLDIARGHAIWPHYTPGDDDLIRSYIVENKLSVLAISERSGVILENDQIHGAGFEPAILFDENVKIILGF